MKTKCLRVRNQGFAVTWMATIDLKVLVFAYRPEMQVIDMRLSITQYLVLKKVTFDLTTEL